MKNLWMVRAGKGSVYIDDFLEKGVVSLGFDVEKDLSGFSDRDKLFELIQEEFPNYKRGRLVNIAGQLFRFINEIQVGDEVLTYDSSGRTYRLGEIASDYRFENNVVDSHSHCRSVNWIAEIHKDRVSKASNYSLGSILSLFLIKSPVVGEIRALASGNDSSLLIAKDEIENEVLEDEFESFEERSKEFIKDRLILLSWQEMQDLVAGLLRAMGYKTKVSPSGPDRGKDIVASPDGFGFEQPRIVVEVKHRLRKKVSTEQMGSFLNGRHKDDKGLYVSTGGFTKEAVYEAERAAIPVTLMDLDALVEGLVDNYDSVDTEVRALLPLRKIYLPA